MILKICGGTWENASRDKRELSVCRELGEQVAVLAKGNPDDMGRIDSVDGFDVHRYSTRPLGVCMPKTLNRIVSLFTWAHYTGKILRPQIISGHDLSGLMIGWLSKFLFGCEATLIYDSHEFEIGRNTKRNKFQLWWITHLERFLIKRCAFAIMVNDAIADEVQQIHKLSQRPIVVRSTPNRWTVDAKICADRRKELCSMMTEPKDFVLMYHGVVMGGRGIETLLKVVQTNPNVCVVILGNGEENYLNSLKKLVEQLGVAERVAFHLAVPLEELWQYVGAADVGMILAPAIGKNHLYSLPNKFFENIQSETPVVCPEYPAMSPIVEQYGIGLTCDPTDVEAVNACVERMRNDKEFYAQCKENTKIAKQDLCWEKEKEVLKQAYKKVLKL